MEYWKIKKSIREVLEQNKEKISDRAEARVIGMSQKGYISMMEKHTMTVKKLEEIASILNKTVSYFFVTSEKNDQKAGEYKESEINMDVVGESEEKYCRGCKELRLFSQLQQGIIDSQEKNLEDLRHHIRTLENTFGIDLAKTGSQ